METFNFSVPQDITVGKGSLSKLPEIAKKLGGKHYRKSVKEVIQLLVKLPDQNSQQIRSRLEKVLNLPAVPTPKLTTLGLLG